MPTNALIVFCHPLTDSFCARIATTVRETVEGAGCSVVFHDLYREGFDPVLSEEEYRRKFSLDLPVQRYMDEVTEADLLVFIHPDWWGQMPAVLKGWVDRVFRPGIAYEYLGEEFLRKELKPLLSGKRGAVFCTTDADAAETRHPLEIAWGKNVFGYSGIEGRCTMFHSIWSSTPAERREYLSFVSSHISGIIEGKKPLPGDLLDSGLNPAD